MADPGSPEAWTRLGKALTSRRGQLDPKYRNRQTFATDKKIDYRVVFDLEKGARDNYRAPTISALEAAYGLAQGAFERFRADETLVEFPDRTGEFAVHITDEPEPDVPPGPPRGFSDGPAGSKEWRLGNRERAIWDGPEPWQVRWGAIKLLRGGTAPLRSTNPGDEQINGRRGA